MTVATTPNKALVRLEVADITAVRSLTDTAPLFCRGFPTAACVPGNGGVRRGGRDRASGAAVDEPGGPARRKMILTGVFFSLTGL
jgi:hypothetical protein